MKIQHFKKAFIVLVLIMSCSSDKSQEEDYVERYDFGGSYNGSLFAPIPFYYLQKDFGQIISLKEKARNTLDSALIGVSYLKFENCSKEKFKKYKKAIYDRGWINFMRYYKTTYLNLHTYERMPSSLVKARHHNSIDIITNLTYKNVFLEHNIGSALHRPYDADITVLIDDWMIDEETNSWQWDHYYNYELFFNLNDPEWKGNVKDTLEEYIYSNYELKEHLKPTLRTLDVAIKVDPDNRKKEFTQAMVDIYKKSVEELDSLPISIVKHLFAIEEDINLCEAYQRFETPKSCERVNDLFRKTFIGKVCAIESMNCSKIESYFHEMHSFSDHFRGYVRDSTREFFEYHANYGIKEYALCSGDFENLLSYKNVSCLDQEDYQELKKEFENEEFYLNKIEEIPQKVRCTQFSQNILK